MINDLIAAVSAQQNAANPGHSAWVVANAGSGKTTVLANRVSRLLLRGCNPQEILCLTYTKTAAAEMQDRLFKQLGKWSMQDDADLRESLVQLGEPLAELAHQTLQNARTLFAMALETPGGLRIQTIHSFCDAVLRRFPFEAGISPNFELLDETSMCQLVAGVITGLADDTQSPAFDAMAANMSAVEDGLHVLAKAILARRRQFDRPFDEDLFRRDFAIAGSLSLESLYRDMLGNDSYTLLESMIEPLKAGLKTDIGRGQDIQRILPDLANPAHHAAIEKLFLHGVAAEKKGPFTAKIDGWATKDVRDLHPTIAADANILALRVANARQKRLALGMLETSRALHDFAAEFLQSYDARKAERGLLDFDDQVAKVRTMLASPGIAQWVLFKLDGGISHVLVDEAQDTSPPQWDVIKSLTEDFFTGAGVAEKPRSIFAVGDEKQSIYSFQGADPEAYFGAKEHFSEKLFDFVDPLEHCDLLYSFRSAQPILRLVDDVMRQQPSGAHGPISHLAPKPEKPGRIELWDRFEKETAAVPPPWHLPDDMPIEEKPLVRLAQKIAAWLQVQLRDGVIPEKDVTRRLRPGDILILVQKRGRLFDALLSAMKALDLPVAGADLFALKEELAVKDLLAVLSFVATPFDDLSLAAALRSPICGLSEAELFALASERGGASLWERLQAQNEQFPVCVEMFEKLRRNADFTRPFELLEMILTEFGGRKKLVGRLGREAIEGIDELLSQSLVFESVSVPSLIGFLDWIDQSDQELKRQIDSNSNLIRIMTVHGAKGLESPMVILPETGQQKPPSAKSNIHALADGSVVWAPISQPKAEVLQRAIEAESEKTKAEKLRLLYVAMTRAEHWLVVCGAESETNSDTSWYSLIESGFGLQNPTRRRDALIVERNWPTKAEIADLPAGTPTLSALPDWLKSNVAAPTKRNRALSPSKLGGAHAVLDLENGSEDDYARCYGRWIHLLLEHLPHVQATDFPAIADNLFAVDESPPNDVERDMVLNEVTKLLAAPHLVELFRPTNLAEVAFATPVEQRHLLGRIDRLVVTPDRIVAVDFKSNAKVPTRPTDVPEGILRQMGAYAHALAAIWPSKEIETAILWTKTAELMVLPQNIAMDAFARRDKP